jgi:hypothetical protein
MSKLKKYFHIYPFLGIKFNSLFLGSLLKSIREYNFLIHNVFGFVFKIVAKQFGKKVSDNCNIFK